MSVLSGVYRKRRSQNSPYFRCVEDYFDKFEQVYEDRFARQYGFFAAFWPRYIHWAGRISVPFQRKIEAGNYLLSNQS